MSGDSLLAAWRVAVRRSPRRARRMHLLVRLAMIAATVCAPAAGGAQSASRDSVRPEAAQVAQWRVGVFVGGARNSPVTRLGVTPGRNHTFVGLDAETTVLRLGWVRVNYAFQLLPYVMIRGQPQYMYYATAEGDQAEPDRAYAYGISPFGIELSSPATARVALFGAAAAGGLVFDRPFPIPEAQRVNFTLEYGGGAMLRVGHAHWIRAGYKYHHISNAYLAQSNPGLDGNVYYVGYQWSVYLSR